MKKLLLSMSLLACTLGFSQQTTTSSTIRKKCGTTDYHKHKMETDPAYATTFLNSEAQTAAYIAANPNGNMDKAVITLPVVVHVVYRTATENISDAQVRSQIDVLNEDFRKAHAQVSSIPAVWQNTAADCELQFCLATTDPSGNPTTGIIRKQTNTTMFNGDDDIRQNSSGGANPWPENQYINIWVGNLSGVYGITLTTGALSSMVGPAVTYNAFGRVGTLLPEANKGKTLVHELGHFFGLNTHIWGDDGGSCSGSDNIADTPNQADQTSSFASPSFPLVDACSPNSPGIMFMNYMDYSGDNYLWMFTQGQKTKMRSVLANSYQALTTSTNVCGPSQLYAWDVQAVEIQNIFSNECGTSINPAVSIKNTGTNTVTSLAIKYKIDAGLWQTYNWTGSLASGFDAVVNLPAVTASNGPHTYSVQLGSPNGNTDQNTANNTTSFAFTKGSGLEHILSITTDNYGEETSFKIFNTANTVIYELPVGTLGSATTYDIPVCLDNGCYKLIIYDTPEGGSQPDGICCNYGQGSYTFKGPNGQTIGTGGQFGASVTHNFCTNNGSVGIEEANSTKLTLYPNPAKDFITLETREIPANSTILVTDVVGKIVVSQLVPTTTNSVSISLQNLATGAYFISLQNSVNSPVLKFIKQ